MTMVHDPRFETKDPQPQDEYRDPDQPKKRNPWTTCLIGCLAVAVLGLILFAAAGIWIWRNWRAFMATSATQAMNQMIDTTDLPAEERREIKLEVRRVADAFREGELSNEQLLRIVEGLANSPLMTVFVVSAVDKQYLEGSGLSDEEKEEGRRTLRRFIRGAMDDTIDESEVDAVMEHVADKQASGGWQMQEKVSDAELRAALAEAKQAADEAGIPEEPESVDASAEFKRIVDEVMGGGEAPPVEDDVPPAEREVPPAEEE